MKNNSEKNGKSSTTTSTSTSKKGKNKSSGSSSSNNSNNNSSEKPKQPQRGLGVAQLEKIRLHSQMASCGVLHHHHHPAAATFLNSPFQNLPEEIRYQLEYQASLQTPPQPFCYPTPPHPYGYQHLQNNSMNGMGDRMERAKNMGYNESQFHNSARWNPNNNVIMIPENYPCTQQPGMVTRHLLSNVERPERNKFLELERAKNQKSEASENDELDLELRL